MNKQTLWRNSLIRAARPLGRVLAASALLLPLGLSAPAQAQVAAKSADSFVESIGVNTHWSYPSYGNYDGLKQKLGESGIRYIRDGNASIYYKFNDLYSTYGIRTDVEMGRRTGNNVLDLSQLNAELNDIKTGITAGAVASLEGPNEYNERGNGDGENNWVSKIQTYTKDLYTKAKADATLKNFPILGPSFTDANGSYGAVGSLDPWIDYATLHPYQSDRNPGTGGWGDDGYGSIYWLKKYGSSVQSPSGKPVQATECGYHNDYNFDGLSEEAEGKYTARMYAEFFSTGFSARSYKYELVNQDAVGTYKEGVFGLLRNDLTEKPSFRAVKNLIAVLSDKGAAFTPGSLNYTLTGRTDNVHQQLFQKRNGDFYLMLWLEVSSWDVNANTNQYPAAQSVTLSVPGGLTAATKYELNNNADMSTAALTISSNALALSVSDKIMIVKLTTGSAPATTAPDLVVTDIGWSPAAPAVGGALTFSATIKNQGTGATPAGVIHGVGFWVDGAKTTWSDNSTGALAAGASRTVTATGPLYTLTAGSHAVEAFVDDVNRISESNEDNNKLTKTLAATTTGSGNTFAGVYKLVARHSGKLLDVSEVSNANGAATIQWADWGGANQLWQVEAVGDGYYKLTAQHSGKCLDVSEASTAEGAKVQQWTDNSSPAQRWKIEPTSDGYCKLTAQSSGKVLDVQGGPSATGNGAPVKQYTYGGGLNQQWKLEPVSAGRQAVAALVPAPAGTGATAPTEKAVPTGAAPAAGTEAALVAYPNPSHGQATLGLEAKEAQRALVYVHSAQGNLVGLFTVPVKAGHTDFALPSTLFPGTYFIRTKVDGQAQRFTLRVE